MCPLISTVSYTLQFTSITCLQTQSETMSVFAALIAEPGTGKSPALKLFKKAITNIEEYLSVEPDDSKLVNGKIVFGSGMGCN